MARPKKITKETKIAKSKSRASSVSVSRDSADQSLFDKLQSDINQRLNFNSDKQSYLNLVLGALIVLVIGALLFNYFNKQKGDLGPAEQTANQDQKQEDVKKENLPGKYTVKEGDNLFAIAQNYYNDGYKYTEIIKANKLDNADFITTGQVLEIPKVEVTPAVAEATPSPSTQIASESAQVDKGTGGADNQTIWGEKITVDTYTVQPGDWLSKVAGRAYGDEMQFDKIAKANNISNPDLIEPGTVLKIPR